MLQPEESDQMELDSIEDIVADIRAGRMVIMMDDEDRENEGDLIIAAEKATPEAIAFFVRYTSGIICMPMMGKRLEELRLPQMVSENTDTRHTAYTVSVDCKIGTTTGISAHDRAKTIRALADPASSPDAFNRPGHIFPLRYTEGGVLFRTGHTEASVDLVRLAGLESPAAVISEVVNDDGTMKRAPELMSFAREHGIRIGTIADLIHYRMQNEKSVSRIVERQVSTEFGDMRLITYKDHVSQAAHFALVAGELIADEPTLVRVHLQNALSDVLAIRSDALGWPFRDALSRIAKEGGVAVVLHQPESPADLARTLESLPAKPAPAENEDGAQVLRTYGVGAQILIDLGVRRMRVLSAPKKMHGISGFGLEVVEYVS
ncbi:MAG TPA: 3,4-dihydroxy-2-butanone-4-phosphate synthase [Gammaproteobacteria bacterium]|jgi:3,4-dihydroxy 2-butanone 4-phosphate synthase/GTP cyclohydrolase II|nr:3,4-dihydroxy-2-butanone-4-phosphate synthase [Gammaproteobacteria bacterium]